MTEAGDDYSSMSSMLWAHND